ncbi:MAG: hypothetical protein ABW133_08680 [Polyangiaceae bacterium]
MSSRILLRWTSWLALAALPACDSLVGANFDVSLRPVDSGASLDAGRDASTDRSDATDARLDAPSLDAGTDTNIRPDASNDAARDAIDEGVPTSDADPDANSDANSDADPDAGDPDASDGDASDAGTDADGGLRPTIVNGAFIYLGSPNPQPSPIELRGQFISNTIVRGSTSGGITIQGRFQ